MPCARTSARRKLLEYARLTEKGRSTSSWITALPITEHGFMLHKGAFRDAFRLRYGWLITRTYTFSLCLWKHFTLEHACTQLL